MERTCTVFRVNENLILIKVRTDIKMRQSAEIKTNADRVRSMTIDELASFLLDVNDAGYLPCKVIDEKCKHFGTDKSCKDCFKEWLENDYVRE